MAPEFIWPFLFPESVSRFNHYIVPNNVFDTLATKLDFKNIVSQYYERIYRSIVTRSFILYHVYTLGTPIISPIYLFIILKKYSRMSMVTHVFPTYWVPTEIIKILKYIFFCVIRCWQNNRQRYARENIFKNTLGAVGGVHRFFFFKNISIVIVLRSVFVYFVDYKYEWSYTNLCECV